MYNLYSNIKTFVNYNARFLLICGHRNAIALSVVVRYPSGRFLFILWARECTRAIVVVGDIRVVGESCFAGLFIKVELDISR